MYPFIFEGDLNLWHRYVKHLKCKVKWNFTIFSPEKYRERRTRIFDELVQVPTQTANSSTQKTGQRYVVFAFKYMNILVLISFEQMRLYSRNKLCTVYLFVSSEITQGFSLTIKWPSWLKRSLFIGLLWLAINYRKTVQHTTLFA